MTDAPIQQTTVPSGWLVSVVTLLNEMACEGVGMLGCPDAADLMVDIAEFLGCNEADDLLEAALLKIREAIVVDPTAAKLWKAYEAMALVERCDEAIREYAEAGISGTMHDLENRQIRDDAMLIVKEMLS